MADRIKVSFGAVDTAASNVTAGASRMQARMQQLQADVAPMLSTWDGESRERYFAAQQKWDQGWQELQSALGELGTKTGTAGQDYQATEQRIAGSFGTH